ncbi:DNA-methyltransferase [Methylobacterium oryzisoli]|uniref:DNA-methyltransferase n=1 Tax=Methylobacterium oryzisoli TaxID=3385502 RepID=UPI0038922DD0
MMLHVLAQETSERFVAFNGDSVEVVSTLPDASVGFSIYSPPFSHLFIYSDSERDMGNVRSDSEFFEQYGYLLRQLHRVTKPGRLTAVHCSDLPRTKATHGEVGIYDMPGDIIRAHIANGWTYHSRICIWKDPVVEMQRTKALGLLYKQLQKDSTRSRQGMPDYVLVFRKTPEDEKTADKVGQDANLFPVHQWQEWASPVWMDIQQTNVLNVRAAREDKDEKHLCPLQLDLIERAIRLWSNPGDTVLSPFMGIGSEGYGALRCGRRFIGIELKASYFTQAVRNLKQTEDEAAGGDLFTIAAE